MNTAEDSHPEDDASLDDLDQHAQVNEFEETIITQSPTSVTSETQNIDVCSGMPSRIGKYEIQRILGQGGFGAVYQGYDDSLDRKVAVKIPKTASDQETVQSFLEEARHIARVSHPGIVTVFDVGIEDGFCYLVSDYLAGDDLNRWLKKHQPTWQESVKIVAAVADALAAAHSRNVIHRDVKPANIIMTNRAEGTIPVLVDFGLSVSDQSIPDPHRLPAGTPNYMSPEQFRGEADRIDGRTDIYSLGVVLYRMISGHLPFRADSVTDLCHQVLNDEPRPPRQSIHDLPRELERICLKTLSKNVADRYTTAGDMAAELRRMLKQQENEASSADASGPKPPAARGKQSMKILIAEDHDVTRFKLKTDLEKWGHEVSVAADGQEAWELYQQSEYSIVITDWMMPHVDGLELVRRIRGSEASDYVYIIMLTAKSEMHDIVAGMGAGADDFLTKPFHRDELQVRVRAGARITSLNRELNESNRRLRHSLDAAAEVQQSFLPESKPEMSGFDFSWDHKASVELGGDMLNLVWLDPTHLGLYVLDVNGEGVPAALMATTLSRLMSPPTNENSVLVDRQSDPDSPRILSPAEVARKLNRQFATDSGTKIFFTLVYGILDCESREFCFTSAGHPPVLLQHRDQPPTMIDIAGFPIGLTSESEEFEEQTLKLNSGDRVMMYSDGLPDAMDRHGEVFGAARILEVMDQSRGSALAELTGAVMNALSDWRDGAEFRDDVSVLCFEVA
jgi:serine/threonine protein kinase/serine phosphatase RsbU (regulator of sigma subunit)